MLPASEWLTVIDYCMGRMRRNGYATGTHVLVLFPLEVVDRLGHVDRIVSRNKVHLQELS